MVTAVNSTHVVDATDDGWDTTFTYRKHVDEYFESKFISGVAEIYSKDLKTDSKLKSKLGISLKND